MGIGGQRHAPATLPPGKKPDTHFIGGIQWWGKSRHTGIRSSDGAARSGSLYRLSYPGPPNALNEIQ